MKIEITKTIFNIFGLVFSFLIILIASTGKYFGKIISLVIKCKDRPVSSFPCYGIYDIWIMIIFAVLGIYFLIKIILYFLSVYLSK